jgi:hypothetical protein
LGQRSPGALPLLCTGVYLAATAVIVWSLLLLLPPHLLLLLLLLNHLLQRTWLASASP